MITLTATKREETGKASSGLLSQDLMPAVVYGPKRASENVTLSLPAFKKILREKNESSIIEITGLGTPFTVQIQEVYRDPVTDQPRHADLYAIEKGAKVEVALPINFTGESAAVKAGASLVKVMHEINVEADPANVPHDITVDISSLVEIGDQIHIKDISMPKGVTVLDDAEEVIVIAQEQAVEEEVESAAPDMDAIAVEKKGKEEEGE